MHQLNVEISPKAEKFTENGEILENAKMQINHQIDDWDGIEIDRCKKEMIDTFETFAKKFINHQDQTSWKISGDFFFAPYIAKARVVE